VDARALRAKANELRAEVLKMVYTAQSGHPGGAMGIADIIAVLWDEFLRHRPHEPRWPGRDRFILSNGHTCAILYAVLADQGYFDSAYLATFRELGSPLQGHPSVVKGPPGVEYSGGSLGNGLSFALGTALAGRLQDPPFRVFCMISDGESQEGQIWEAAMAAAHHRVGNLVTILDRNHCQIDGPSDDVMSIEPVGGKWRAFGWHVLQIDGHDIDAIARAFTEALEVEDRPTMIIADTVMARGVDFMEGDCRWHHGAPSRDQMEKALTQLGSGW